MRFPLLIGEGLPALVVFGFASQKDTAGTPLASVTGQVTVLEEGNRLAKDVSDAVVWLEPVRGRYERPDSIPPDTLQMTMSKKEFRPHLMVLEVGSGLAFPNEDSFNHNVFSRSDIAPFDLGRYGRGEIGVTHFGRPGVVRVFCNVHARMSAIVVVLDNPYFARPRRDGTFTIRDVPPGRYRLQAFHERANVYQPRLIDVTGQGAGALRVELDAREYRFVQHLNKFGQPYSRAKRGRRY